MGEVVEVLRAGGVGQIGDPQWVIVVGAPRAVRTAPGAPGDRGATALRDRPAFYIMSVRRSPWNLHHDMHLKKSVED